MEQKRKYLINQLFKVLTILICLVVVIGMLNSCGSFNDEDIIGLWQYKGDKLKIEYQFNSNGNFLYQYDNYNEVFKTNEYAKCNGTYTIHDKNILLYIDIDSIKGSSTAGLNFNGLQQFLKSEDEYITIKIGSVTNKNMVIDDVKYTKYIS